LLSRVAGQSKTGTGGLQIIPQQATTQMQGLLLTSYRMHGLQPMNSSGHRDSALWREPHMISLSGMRIILRVTLTGQQKCGRITFQTPPERASWELHLSLPELRHPQPILRLSVRSPLQ